MEMMAMQGVGRGRLIDGRAETFWVGIALFSEGLIPLFWLIESSNILHSLRQLQNEPAEEGRQGHTVVPRYIYRIVLTENP
jgi:hypothetical protein